MKTSNILLLATLVATALAGCTNDEGGATVADLSDTPICIRAGIQDRILTRAELEPLTEGEFGLFLTTQDTGDDPRYNADNMRFSHETGAWAAVIDESKGETQLLWKNNSAQVGYCAYMPYNDAEGAIADGIYTFNLPTEQNEGEEFKAADLLYAQGTAVASADGAIDITFRHQLSRLAVSLTRGTELDGRNITFQSVMLESCCVASTTIDLNPDASIDTEEGSGESAGSPSETTSGAESVTLYRPDPAEDAFACILIPQNQPLTLLIEATESMADGTAEKKFYRYTSATSLELNSGTSYKLELKVGRDKMTLNSVSVTGWDETGWETPVEGTAKEIIPPVIDEAAHSITMKMAGCLTVADVTKAINLSAETPNPDDNQTYCALNVAGPVNDDDIRTINRWIMDQYGPDYINPNIKLALDLSQTEGLTTLIREAFYYNDGYREGLQQVLHSIVLPGTITKVEYYAFGACVELTKVIFNSPVEAFGDHAFRGCSALKEIDLSHCTTPPTVGTDAFFGVNEDTECTIYVNKDAASKFTGEPWDNFTIAVKGESGDGGDSDASGSGA